MSNVRAIEAKILSISENKEIWVTFVGIVDVPITRKFAEFFTNAALEKVTKIHFLIQSPGGSINEGIFIFNFLKEFPVDVVAYNNGNVSSAATTAYLGAKVRVVSPYATFMVHRATAAPNTIAHLPVVNSAVNSLTIDDDRTKAIIKSCCNLNPNQWKVFSHADLTLDAKQSIKASIAHEIGQFKPNGFMYFI